MSSKTNTPSLTNMSPKVESILKTLDELKHAFYNEDQRLVAQFKEYPAGMKVQIDKKKTNEVFTTFIDVFRFINKNNVKVGSVSNDVWEDVKIISMILLNGKCDYYFNNQTGKRVITSVHSKNILINFKTAISEKNEFKHADKNIHWSACIEHKKTQHEQLDNMTKQFIDTYNEMSKTCCDLTLNEM